MGRLLYAVFSLMFLNTIYAIALSTMLGHPPDFRKSLQVIRLILLNLPCLVLLIPLHRLEGLRSRLHRLVRCDERGAVTLVGLLLFIVLLILFAAFSPVVVTAIDVIKACVTDTISTLVLDLIPAILLLGIVISWLIYASSE